MKKIEYDAGISGFLHGTIKVPEEFDYEEISAAICREVCRRTDLFDHIEIDPYFHDYDDEDYIDHE